MSKCTIHGYVGGDCPVCENEARHDEEIGKLRARIADLEKENERLREENKEHEERYQFSLDGSNDTYNRLTARIEGLERERDSRRE